MKILSTITLLILILFGVTFSILNSATVSLNYYFGVRDISLPLLLVITFAIGAIIGFVLAIPSMIRLRRGNSKLKSRLKESEQDVRKLGYSN